MNCFGDGQRPGRASSWAKCHAGAGRLLIIALVDRLSSPLSSSCSSSRFVLVIALFARKALTPGDGQRPRRALSLAECRAHRFCRARQSLVVALIDCLSPRSLITCRASRCALRAKGVDSGESVEFGRGVRRGGRQQWCGRITRCGGCGGGEGAALGGPMVDGVKRERLREGHQLQTMGGSMGGRRVWPRRAGWKYLW